MIRNKESFSHHFYSKWYWRSSPAEIRQEKMHSDKKKAELSVFTYDLIVYVENPKEFTKTNKQTQNQNPTPKL